MTVAELSGRLSSKELTEWYAYYELEPFGQAIESLGHAITASTVYAAHRGKKGKKLSYKDFLPKIIEKKEQSVDEMVGIAEAMTTALGGQDTRRKKHGNA